MKKLLYIKSNPKEEGESFSLTAGRIFVEKYKQMNPSHVVVEKDLYREDIPEIDQHVISAWEKQKTGEELTYLERRSSKAVNDAVDEFLKYDKYIMASPMWNFFMNWRLKKYIDLLFVVNKTFRYKNGKLEGLLGGRKMVYIQATGGVYIEDEDIDMDLSYYYLKTLFGSVGIDYVEPILIESTNSRRIPPSEIIRRRDQRIEELLQSF